jgi:hypothetical protein
VLQYAGAHEGFRTTLRTGVRLAHVRIVAYEASAVYPTLDESDHRHAIPRPAFDDDELRAIAV